MPNDMYIVSVQRFQTFERHLKHMFFGFYHNLQKEDMDHLKLWFVVSAGSLIALMAFDIVDWNRGLEILRRLVDVFVAFQGMFDRKVLVWKT